MDGKNGASSMPSRSLFGGWRRALNPSAARPRVVRCEEPPPPAFDAAAPEGMEGAPAGPEGAVQFEMFNKEWQNIAMQDNWDGFRIEASNAVTKHLQAAHTLFLGTQLRECGYIYQFGPAFQSEDGRSVLVARAGLDGAVNGRAIQKVGSSMEFKASSNSHLKDPQRNMHEGSVEYNGASTALSGKLAWQGAPLVGAAIVQKLLPYLQVGGDVTVIPVNGLTCISQGGVRYKEGVDTFTAAVSRSPDPKSPVGASMHEFRLHYVRKITERLCLGSEYKFAYPDKESGMSLAYEYLFRQARIQGLLDSDGKVSCCVSDFTGFGFSGSIDYMRGDYKFGVVMHVLPQPEQGQPM